MQHSKHNDVAVPSKNHASVSDSQPKPTTQRAAQSANVANAARSETIHRIEDTFLILQR